MRRSLWAAVAVMALFATACGVASEETSDPDAGVPQVSGACAEDAPDCEGTITVGDDDVPRSEDGDSPPPGASGIVVDGGLSIPEARATDASGVIAVSGFYFDDGTGPRLCELLAESLPPQCGGATLDVDLASLADLGPLEVAQGVTWSNQPVTVLGEFVGSTLVSDGMSI